ncbi:DEAD/DEAH box helicase [Turicibacter bilis]|uniref:DEAD/DEAH box helicase n=1 Tax=Turicibacter bilis TaxID=2735723 RepID=A0A9Q9CKB2_9FIRM|nr:DEAD/DEAH box helicase [Turicibacter bilis]MBS3198193.1 DEAD/DEAH box helicase [Turicibacter bilis]UUF08731.1 DEAD/DEAH box helicase [Turicibacter bilis]
MIGAGEIRVKLKRNPKELYEHQVEALEVLKEIDQHESFKSVLVIPTGGGKTLTACWWLLNGALNNKKKVLWLAHRQLLLEQAAKTFELNAYADVMTNRWGFNYRIISGTHQSTQMIERTDDLLIVSKDSLAKRVKSLDCWLKGEKELYIIVDEAHHASAPTYEKILNHLQTKVPNIKLLGLTATPFRSDARHLSEVFPDDIAYKIDLTDLIKRGILSLPHFEECQTDLVLELTKEEQKKLELEDWIPSDIAIKMAKHKLRNAMIVRQYDYKKYGQTIVFAINRVHALVLKSLFEKSGAKCGVIISRETDDILEMKQFGAENEAVITAYQCGEINILINVNILTEGVDLPQTRSVFLTRPTTSATLMTQMIGRALRGSKAGGTNEAYIVSFIDDWQDKITWVNAKRLVNEQKELREGELSDRVEKIYEQISFAKLEEYIHLLDASIDTTQLESIPFIKRIPLGMYAFTLVDRGIERSHQILIYDSTKRRYDHLIAQLPQFFNYHQIKGEITSPYLLKKLSDICARRCFLGELIPAYDERDVKALLQYFSVHQEAPPFIPFEQLDRERLDLSKVAQTIIDEHLTRSEQRAYIDQLWNSPEALFSIYFHKKVFFMRQLNIELRKLVEGETHEVS